MKGVTRTKRIPQIKKKSLDIRGTYIFLITNVYQVNVLLHQSVSINKKAIIAILLLRGLVMV